MNWYEMFNEPNQLHTKKCPYEPVKFWNPQTLIPMKINDSRELEKSLTDSETGTEAKLRGLMLGDATSLAVSEEPSCGVGSGQFSPRDLGWEGGVSGGVARFKVPPDGWSTANGSSTGN